MPAAGGDARGAARNGFEFVEVLWRRAWRRDFDPPLRAGCGTDEPFVSIHLAGCNEPPEMVILTLDSLARSTTGTSR